MAEENELFQDGLAGPSSPKFAYDVPFFVSSYYFHPTALGLHSHFLQAGQVFDFVQRSDENHLAQEALIFTAQSLMQSAIRMSLFWKTGTEEVLIAFWSRHINYFSKP